MKNLTLENIARVCGGTYYGPADKLQEEVMSVITDSRKAEEGCLFVPIVGERVDAHKFIPQVMEAGHWQPCRNGCLITLIFLISQ